MNPLEAAAAIYAAGWVFALGWACASSAWDPELRDAPPQVKLVSNLLFSCLWPIALLQEAGLLSLGAPGRDFAGDGQEDPKDQGNP